MSEEAKEMKDIEAVTGKKTDMNYKFNFKIKRIDYVVELSEDETKATITTNLKIDADGKLNLITGLYVDGHELLPSAMHHTEKGINDIQLKPIKIIRPKKFWANQPVADPEYTMGLMLSDDGDNYMVNKEIITIAEWIST